MSESKTKKEKEKLLVETPAPPQEAPKSEQGQVVKATKQPRVKRAEKTGRVASTQLEDWHPKTDLGKKVKATEITDITYILDSSKQILESQIVDVLLPNLETDLLLIGQSKGKFGGGQRRVFKQTQKKTREGNKPKFATIAVIGNQDGIVGVGYGKSKETVPAREKAIRNAKLGIFKIRRGCGSWQCGCKGSHSIPFKVQGKCGSVEIDLMPAPKGTGLRMERECQKILEMAGVKDAWSKTRGQTRTKINLIYACVKALKNLMDTKIAESVVANVGLVEGPQESAEMEATHESE